MKVWDGSIGWLECGAAKRRVEIIVRYNAYIFTERQGNFESISNMNPVDWRLDTNRNGVKRCFLHRSGKDLAFVATQGPCCLSSLGRVRWQMLSRDITDTRDAEGGLVSGFTLLSQGRMGVKKGCAGSLLGTARPTKAARV